MKYKEIEVKYSAANIKLKDFRSLIESIAQKVRWQEVSSYDSYYVNSKDRFLRYRYDGDKGQLTTKEKTSDINNNNRVEYNLNMHNNKYEAVAGLCESLGFKYNFRIFKMCHIAWLEKIDFVYYVVYNEELKEVDRFIEIEALEDYEWTSEQEAWDEITKYEKLLEPLGITAQNRMRKSLFEIYKK